MVRASHRGPIHTLMTLVFSHACCRGTSPFSIAPCYVPHCEEPRCLGNHGRFKVMLTGHDMPLNVERFLIDRVQPHRLTGQLIMPPVVAS